MSRLTQEQRDEIGPVILNRCESILVDFALEIRRVTGLSYAESAVEAVAALIGYSASLEGNNFEFARAMAAKTAEEMQQREFKSLS